MAFVGHKLTQTLHDVHDVRYFTSGFFPVPSSRTPWGQTPTQINPGQETHFS
jgi:hypothetical protein